MGQKLLNLLVLVLLFIVSIAVVFADNDGNIDVRVTRLDSGFSTTTLIVITFVVVIALIFSLVLLLKRRSSPVRVPLPKERINLNALPEPALGRKVIMMLCLGSRFLKLECLMRSPPLQGVLWGMVLLLTVILRRMSA